MYVDSDTNILHKVGVFDAQISVPPSRAAAEPRGSVDSDNVQTSLLIIEEEPTSNDIELDDCSEFHNKNGSIAFHAITFAVSIVYGYFLLNSAVLLGGNVYFMNLVFFALGMPIGCFIASHAFVYVKLFTSVMFSGFFAYAFVFVSFILEYRLCFFGIGIVAGFYERNTYYFVNEYCGKKWKVHLSLSYIIFFVGILCMAIAMSPDLADPNHQLHVRSVRQIIDGPEFHPTKPSSALGILENQDTKTAENAEKRKLAEIKLQEKAANCEDGDSLSPLCSNKTVEETTVQSTPTETSTLPATTVVTVTVDDRSRNRVTKVEKVMLVTDQVDAAIASIKHDVFHLVIFGFCTLCVVTMVSSCMPFSPFVNLYFPLVHDSFDTSHVTTSVDISTWLICAYISMVTFACLPLMTVLAGYHHPEELVLWGYHFTAVMALIFGLIVFRCIMLWTSKLCLPGTTALVFVISIPIAHLIMFFLPENVSTLVWSFFMLICLSSLPVEIYSSLRESLLVSPHHLSGRVVYGSCFGRIFSGLIFYKIYFNSNNDLVNVFRSTQVYMLSLLIGVIVFYRFVMTALRKKRAFELSRQLRQINTAVPRTPANPKVHRPVYSAVSTGESTTYDDFDSDDSTSESSRLLDD